MDGVLLVDKPAGRTSHAVTSTVRRDLGIRKAGHAGTLDPFATGLLLVLVGRARRTQRLFTALPKEYEAVARFGAVSDTGDPEGEITTTGVLPDGELALPTGCLRQRPPAFSAVKVGGRRAYDLARRGEEVVLPEREVTVYDFEQLWRSGDRVGLRLACSSGTYVRSLVADLGDAYTEELRRTRIGPFDVADADPRRVVALPAALGFLRRLTLPEELARAVAHGRPVEPPAAPVPPSPGWEVPEPPPEILLLDEGGDAVALALEREDGSLKPVVGFRPS